MTNKLLAIYIKYNSMDEYHLVHFINCLYYNLKDEIETINCRYAPYHDMKIIKVKEVESCD